MANWEGYARSNYFKVKDEEKFRAWATGLNLEIYEEGGLFGIASEDGDWPDQRENEENRPGRRIRGVEALAEIRQQRRGRTCCQARGGPQGYHEILALTAGRAPLSAAGRATGYIGERTGPPEARGFTGRNSPSSG